MRKRAASWLIGVVALVVIISSAGYSGYLLGRRSVGATVSNLPDPQANLSIFWEAWNVINQYYYGDKDPAKRVDGAIAGMVSGLQDPYTTYFEPVQNRQFRSDIAGSFGGIGAELTMKDNLLTVVAPLDGTPAQAAGLKAGDVITEIDGTKTSDYTFDVAIDKIRGQTGTQVTLTVARPGTEAPLTLKITRNTITVKSVKSSSVGPAAPGTAVAPGSPTPTTAVGEKGDIAYIKVNQFGDDTADLFRSALQDAKTSNKKGIIVDLRDNPGGLLDKASDMIGMVLPAQIDSSQELLHKRIAVEERYKDGSKTDTPAGTDVILDKLPMVVLVNGGSASASEIFAGAMRDYKRATLVGTKTFGKGSVQDLVDLSNGGSIKVTVAKWFTPLGITIDGKGLEPDVTVTLPADVQPSTTDAQVAKAVEILDQQPK